MGVVLIVELVCLMRRIRMGHLNVTAEALWTIVIVDLVLGVPSALCLTIERVSRAMLRSSQRRTKGRYA